MAKKSLLPRGYKTWAEKLSIQYRKELGLSEYDSLDAFNLAQYLDVPIAPLASVCEGNILRILEKSFDALWMNNIDGDKIIVYNSNRSVFRQQSNLMHELSHIIRGHEIPDEIKNTPIPFDLHYYNEQQEEEAKYLGGCLQINRNSLLRCLRNGLTQQEISEHYNASLDMVNYRVNITGVMKQLSYKYK